MHFHVTKAAQMLGIHPSTLRDLENRGAIPPVRRDWSGYRVYSEEELAEIEKVLFSGRASYIVYGQEQNSNHQDGEGK